MTLFPPFWWVYGTNNKENRRKYHSRRRRTHRSTFFRTTDRIEGAVECEEEKRKKKIPKRLRLKMCMCYFWVISLFIATIIAPSALSILWSVLLRIGSVCISFSHRRQSNFLIIYRASNHVMSELSQRPVKSNGMQISGRNKSSPWG